MHALSAVQKNFSLRHPCRAPAHVHGNIELFKGI